MSANKPCATACTVAALLSAAAGGGLIVFAFYARGDEETDLSAVLDAAGIVTVLVAVTVVLWVVTRLLAPLLGQVAANQWEIRRLSRELADLRKAQPTAKAIAGYAMATLLSDEDDQGAEVVNLRG